MRPLVYDDLFLVARNREEVDVVRRVDWTAYRHEQSVVEPQVDVNPSELGGHVYEAASELQFGEVVGQLLISCMELLAVLSCLPAFAERVVEFRNPFQYSHGHSFDE